MKKTNCKSEPQSSLRNTLEDRGSVEESASMKEYKLIEGVRQLNAQRALIEKSAECIQQKFGEISKREEEEIVKYTNIMNQNDILREKNNILGNQMEEHKAQVHSQEMEFTNIQELIHILTSLDKELEQRKAEINTKQNIIKDLDTTNQEENLYLKCWEKCNKELEVVRHLNLDIHKIVDEKNRELMQEKESVIPLDIDMNKLELEIENLKLDTKNQKHKLNSLKEFVEPKSKRETKVAHVEHSAKNSLRLLLHIKELKELSKKLEDQYFTSAAYNKKSKEIEKNIQRMGELFLIIPACFQKYMKKYNLEVENALSKKIINMEISLLKFNKICLAMDRIKHFCKYINGKHIKIKWQKRNNKLYINREQYKTKSTNSQAGAEVLNIMEEVLSYDRFIGFHRNQRNPDEFPPHTLAFAYGYQKYEKMVEELKTDDHILRTKVLIELNEDLHRGDKINKGLETELLKELFKALQEKDDKRRTLASSAIMLIANNQTGREQIFEAQKITNIRMLFDDEIVEIRRNGYIGMLNLTEFTDGKEQVVNSDVLPVLVDKLIFEIEEDILILVLQLLGKLTCAENAPKILLQTQVINRLNKHIKSKNEIIRELAILNLGYISFQLDGKYAVIKSGSIPILCELLNDKVVEVRVTATKTLTCLANIKQGKVDIMKCGAMERITQLLKEEDDRIVLNTIQLIANVSDHPDGREYFKGEALAILTNLQTASNQLLQRFSKIAANVITWTPQKNIYTNYT